MAALFLSFPPLLFLFPILSHCISLFFSLFFGQKILASTAFSTTKKKDQIDGIQSVHELHIWRLNQIKSVATAHIVVDDGNFKDFTEMATIIMECLHAYGIHSATLQPEASPLAVVEHAESASGVSEGAVRERRINQRSCQLICNSVCSGMRCCT